MNNQTNQRLQTILLATITTILLFSAFGSTFAQGVGAKYNSRDPRTCADATSPKTGALSAAKAAEYVICENEHESGGGYIYFVEDVKVQVGSGRLYNPREDINFSGIDTKFPIYPIRGSYKSYQCTAIFPDKTNTNRNCNSYSAPKATGACYKKSGFGEWRCMLVDINEEKTAENIPPPGAAKQNPTNNAENKTQNNAEPKNKTADQKPTTKAGMPEPDFSEMMDWFEIVRYEYPKPPESKMWVYFKAKTDDSKPYIFYVEFRDKDGILVQDATYSPMCCSSELMSTAKGEMSKVRIELPPESIMKQVTSIKVIRAK